MPFALVTIGLLLVITGFQNTYSQLGSQVVKDFSGQGNFTYWIIALFVVGAIGYNETLKPFSRAFMALIIIGIFLSRGKGFFSQFNKAIDAGTSTSPLPAGGAGHSTMLAAEGGGNFFGDAFNLAGDITKGAELAATFASFV